ncbi:hypothetical protein KSW77_07750, partial [Prevotella copri]
GLTRDFHPLDNAHAERTTKIGPVSQQTLNILTKTKLTTKKTNISKLEDEIITSHPKSNL